MLMKIAVVGATGLVGREILRVLDEHDFPVDELIPVATPKSYGIPVEYRGKTYDVTGHETAIAQRPQVAIFSAGASTSREWAPRYAEAGITVIDNSSAWRMEQNIPLIVPEINGDVLKPGDRIIANPNCSTLGLVMILAPLHAKYIIRRVVVSTYQSVTGTGAKALKQLENERAGISGEMAYPHPIDLNLFPHGGYFLDNGYTSEEMKLLHETRKILRAPGIRLTATVVRVPVTGGHSLAANIEFEKEFIPSDIVQTLTNMPGVIVADDVVNNIYPMPLTARGRDEVFVGRIRRDESVASGLDLFITADNLRKGAATNAVQIASYLLAKKIL